MCKGGVVCSPCAAKQAIRAQPLVAVEMAGAEAEREVIVWGPASVEVEAVDGKVIHAEAVEQALPQLLKRGGVDLFHRSSFTVGEVVPEFTVDPARMRPGARVKRVVDEAGGVLRSAMYEVTQSIVDLFPRLAPVKGTRQLFLASRIFGDNKTSRLAQERALRGELDSYSIAGVGTEVAQTCTSDGCTQHVLQMDLGAVTLCGQQERPHVGVPKAKNPLAGFVVVQMADESPIFLSLAAPSPMPPTHGDTHMKPKPSAKPAAQEVPVEQAEDAPGAEGKDGSGGGDPVQRLETAAVDQGRRIEQLEQRVAELAGSQTSTAQEKADEVEDAEDDEEDPEEEPDMKPKNPKDKTPPEEEEAVEQAQESAPPAWFTGFVSTMLPGIVEQAVAKAMPKPAAAAVIEQAQPAPAPAPTPAPAAPRASIAPPPAPVASPSPQAAPQAGGHLTNKTPFDAAIEAAESGNPAAFQEAWGAFYPSLRSGKGGN